MDASSSVRQSTGIWQQFREMRIAGMSPGMLLLLILLAVVAAVGWSNTLDEPRLLGWHENMIHATASAPDQYRVLTPILVEGIFWLMDPTVAEAIDSLRIAYRKLHILAFIATGFFFVPFCRRWLSPGGALASFAILMGICAVANLRGQIQVADPMNLMFASMGLWAIQRRVLWVLVVAIMLGALNRESILVLMGFYVLMEWPRPKRSVLLTAALLAVAWGVAYGSLRLGFGMRSYYVEPVMLWYNFSEFWRWAPPLLLLGPLLLAALVRALSEWPAPLRRATLVIPPYLLLHLVIARIEEVRLFLPLLLVLVPLAVLGISAEERTSTSSLEGDDDDG